VQPLHFVFVRIRSVYVLFVEKQGLLVVWVGRRKLKSLVVDYYLFEEWLLSQVDCDFGVVVGLSGLHEVVGPMLHSVCHRVFIFRFLRLIFNIVYILFLIWICLSSPCEIQLLRNRVRIKRNERRSVCHRVVGLKFFSKLLFLMLMHCKGIVRLVQCFFDSLCFSSQHNWLAAAWVFVWMQRALQLLLRALSNLAADLVIVIKLIAA
jgi:hypothetical protein